MSLQSCKQEVCGWVHLDLISSPVFATRSLYTESPAAWWWELGRNLLVVGEPHVGRGSALRLPLFCLLICYQLFSLVDHKAQRIFWRMLLPFFRAYSSAFIPALSIAVGCCCVLTTDAQAGHAPCLASAMPHSWNTFPIPIFQCKHWSPCLRSSSLQLSLPRRFV